MGKQIENFNNRCSFYELHTYHLVQSADRSAIKRTWLLSKKEFRAVRVLASTHLRHSQPIGLLRGHMSDLALPKLGASGEVKVDFDPVPSGKYVAHKSYI